MIKKIPRADEQSAGMGWNFDPGFIQDVRRVADDAENVSMESIDAVLSALARMGCVSVAPAGFAEESVADGSLLSSVSGGRDSSMG